MWSLDSILKMRDTKACLYIKRKIDDIGEGRDFQEQGKKGRDPVPMWRGCPLTGGMLHP